MAFKLSRPISASPFLSLFLHEEDGQVTRLSGGLPNSPWGLTIFVSGGAALSAPSPDGGFVEIRASSGEINEEGIGWFLFGTVRVEFLGFMGDAFERVSQKGTFRMVSIRLKEAIDTKTLEGQGRVKPRKGGASPPGYSTTEAEEASEEALPI